MTMPTRRVGMAQLGANSGPVTRTPFFSSDYLRDVCKRSALSVGDDSKFFPLLLYQMFILTVQCIVPVIDLREWFTGARRNEPLRLDTLLMQAPRLNTEVDLNSLVAVFHSMGTYHNKMGSTSLSLNLYAVAVLVGPSAQSR